MLSPVWLFMECSLPGSSVRGILQARILEWVAIPFSKGSSWPRDWTQVSYITGRFFTIWATREGNVPYQMLTSPLVLNPRHSMRNSSKFLCPGGRCWHPTVFRHFSPFPNISGHPHPITDFLMFQRLALLPMLNRWLFTNIKWKLYSQAKKK